MSEPPIVIHYLNPLTVEARLFLNSIENMSKTCNQIDTTLCDTLHAVVNAIDRFLSQRPLQIVQTDRTKLVAQKELAAIERSYHCRECKIDLGQKAEQAAFHLVEKHRVINKKQIRKLRRKVENERLVNTVQKLPKKAKALFATDWNRFFCDRILVAENLKRIPQYQTIETQLINTIKPIFPDENVRIFKFGSRINGIATKSSDLDIYVEIGNTSTNFENRASGRTLYNLQKVYDVFRDSKIWSQVVCIDKARVPILKVFNAGTGIDCDIGISNSLGFYNSKVMEYMYELQPIARRMCVFMKTWLDRCKLREHMSTYAITLMVLFFLQMRKLLPAVHLIQTDDDEAVHVGPWIASFKSKSLSDFNMQKMEISVINAQNILRDFFAFYASFKYEQYAVSPYLGRMVEIKHIEAEMPPRYTNYIKEKGEGKDCMLQLAKEIVVQDFLQLNHNVTKSISQCGLKIIVDYFRDSEQSIGGT